MKKWWYVDGLNARAGRVFASFRAQGTDASQADSCIFLGAPEFSPEPVSASLSLAATRHGFQENLFDERGEIAFESEADIAEFTRRIYFASSLRPSESETFSTHSVDTTNVEESSFEKTFYRQVAKFAETSPSQAFKWQIVEANTDENPSEIGRLARCAAPAFFRFGLHGRDAARVLDGYLVTFGSKAGSPAGPSMTSWQMALAAICAPAVMSSPRGRNALANAIWASVCAVHSRQPWFPFEVAELLSHPPAIVPALKWLEMQLPTRRLPSAVEQIITETVTGAMSGE